MLIVQMYVGTTPTIIYNTNEGIGAKELREKVTELTGLENDHFYVVHKGRLARETDVCENGTAEVVLRLPGGKGGFGSMLRAIGAQIEKTTNREACRDLSGRRLRDINEEKRLKSWIEKQATREEEAVERKKKKLERLCAQPKHEFKDKNYEMERSTLTEKVGDAVEEGFKLSMAGTSGVKRKHEDKTKRGKKKLILDLDIDSDELGSSSDESNSDSSSEKIPPTVKSSETNTVEVSDTEKITESEKSDSLHNSDASNHSVTSSTSETPNVAKVEMKESADGVAV